jgi:hypothetical protein
MTSGGRRNDLSDNFTLARKLGLCFGCGQLYPKGTEGRSYDRAAHDRGCRKKFVRGIVTDEFNVGIAKWRGLHDTGRYSEQALVELANSERRSLAGIGKRCSQDMLNKHMHLHFFLFGYAYKHIW